jgi:hypothetical protein
MTLNILTHSIMTLDSECCFSECRICFKVLLSINILNAVILSVVPDIFGFDHVILVDNQSANMSVEEMSVGQMSVSQISLGQGLTTECLSAKFLLANCWPIDC